MARNTVSIFMAAAAISCLGACSSPMGASRTPSPPVSWGEGSAKRNCGECHAIGAVDRSKLADAPPFRDLRSRYSRAAMDALLRERMVDIHPRMPVLTLDDSELSAFLDYWQTIEPSGAR